MNRLVIPREQIVEIIKVSMISVENNRIKKVESSNSVIQKICDVLGISFEDFLTSMYKVKSDKSVVDIARELGAIKSEGFPDITALLDTFAYTKGVLDGMERALILMKK